MYAVERLLEVYTIHIQLSLPLCALFNDVAECEDLISTSSTFHETGLFLSQCSDICLMMTLARILLGTDNKVIPLQLLQSVNAPFFGSLHMNPLVLLSGTFSSFQTAVNSGSKMVAASQGSALKSSASRLSSPGDLMFLRVLIAAAISSLCGRSILISRSSAVSRMSAFSSGEGQLSTSLKRSAHLSSCSCLLSAVFPGCL